jgi:hypothetical protein
MKQKLFLVGLALVFFALNLNAQGVAWKTATSGGYTYKYVTGDPTHSRFYTLKNGLTVILSPTAKTAAHTGLYSRKSGQ